MIFIAEAVRYNTGYSRKSTDPRPQKSPRGYSVQPLSLSCSMPTAIPEQWCFVLNISQEKYFIKSLLHWYKNKVWHKKNQIFSGLWPSDIQDGYRCFKSSQQANGPIYLFSMPSGDMLSKLNQLDIAQGSYLTLSHSGGSNNFSSKKRGGQKSLLLTAKGCVPYFWLPQCSDETGEV